MSCIDQMHVLWDISLKCEVHSKFYDSQDDTIHITHRVSLLSSSEKDPRHPL